MLGDIDIVSEAVACSLELHNRTCCDDVVKPVCYLYC